MLFRSDEIELVAESYKVKVTFVSSYAHNMTVGPTSKVVMVDAEREAVDLYIANHIKKKDVCVTHDYGLASLLLTKGATVISPRGQMFDHTIIDSLLAQRHQSQKDRRAGKKTKGPRAYLKGDRERFIQQFEKILSNRAGI